MLVNCSNINELHIQQMLGKGSHREVYKGEIYGRKVAVKVARYDGNEVSSKCLSDRKHMFCHKYPYLVTLWEILLSYQLDHPGIVKILGYCVKDIRHSFSPHDPLNKRGVISVFELGQKFNKAAKLSLKERLQFSFDLADVMDYLAHSPIGSVMVDDLLLGDNFIIIDGHLKISDLEYSHAKEPSCNNISNVCFHGVECVNGECVGANARIMMDRLKGYFTDWLNVSTIDIAPGIVQRKMQNLSTTLMNSTMTAGQVKSEIEAIQQMVF